MYLPCRKLQSFRHRCFIFYARGMQLVASCPSRRRHKLRYQCFGFYLAKFISLFRGLDWQVGNNCFFSMDRWIGKRCPHWGPVVPSERGKNGSQISVAIFFPDTANLKNENSTSSVNIWKGDRPTSGNDLELNYSLQFPTKFCENLGEN